MFCFNNLSMFVQQCTHFFLCRCLHEYSNEFLKDFDNEMKNKQGNNLLKRTELTNNKKNDTFMCVFVFLLGSSNDQVVMLLFWGDIGIVIAFYLYYKNNKMKTLGLV